MSRIQVPMPQMGESIAEGTVSVWLKKVGDPVDRDEPIMEISTDKVDAEIPSPAAGVLAEILVEAGQTVEVGTVVAYLETEPEGAGPPGEPAPPAAAGAADEQPDGVRREATPGAPPTATPGAARGASPVASPATAPLSAAREGAEETEEERLRRRSTPLVRRIAEEHGVRIEEVTGSGRGGRVTKEDILRHLEGGGESLAATPAPDGGGAEGEGEGEPIGWDDFYSRVEHPRVAAVPGDRVEPMDRMTSLIAEHMVLSRRISAHVHSFIEVDYTRIDRLREANRAVWEEQSVKVTYTAFIAVAVARALRDFPRLNASISGRNVIYRGEINLGVAVALDWGLIVPVVRNAGDLSIEGMAKAITDLALRARAKKLDPAEVQGGTFTITNPGIFGTVLGLPIVNQPQVAILGIGSIGKRAVVVPDEFGGDAIVARRRGYLSLGFDHRLVNGADADRFLGRVREILETMGE